MLFLSIYFQWFLLELLALKQCTCIDPVKFQAPLIIVDPGQDRFILIDAISYASAYLPVNDVLIPVAIDVDVGANLMFWTDVRSKRIYKASLYGGNQVIIKTLPTNAVPDGLAVDDTTQTIFYTDTGQNFIATIDYNGNNQTILVSQGLDEVRTIVLDKQARKMYWTDWGLSPNIMSATYEGGNKVILTQITNIKWPNGLTLDVTEQILYWCDGGVNRIESIKTDGTGRKLLASEFGTHYFGIILRESYLYITDWNSRYLKRLHTSGGSVQRVGSPLFTKAYGLVSVSNITINTTRLSSTTTISPTKPDPVKFQAPLIIVDPGQNRFILMDAISYASAYLPVNEVLIPVAIDVDLGANLMFWTDVRSKRIYKASLYGGNQVVIKALPTNAVPDGLAVDDTTQTIFYTDTGQNIIATIDYSGYNQKILVSHGLDEVRAIVLDKQAKKMYWTDWGLSPNIMSATYEGGNKVILTQITNLKWPNGLALDVTEQILYWCDAGVDRIESIKTDGTGRKLLASEFGTHYFGIILRESYLYITDWNSRYLKRLHKSGGSVQRVGSALFNKAYGLVSVSAAPNITITTTRLSSITSTARSTTATSTTTTTGSITSTPSIKPTTKSTTTTTSQMNDTNEETGQQKGLNTTLIIILAICVVGFIVLVIILTVGVWCCLKKRRSDASSPPYSPNVDTLAVSNPHPKLSPATYNAAFESDDTYNDISDIPYISLSMPPDNSYMGLQHRATPYVSSDYINPGKN